MKEKNDTAITVYSALHYISYDSHLECLFSMTHLETHNQTICALDHCPNSKQMHCTYPFLMHDGSLNVDVCFHFNLRALAL